MHESDALSLLAKLDADILRAAGVESQEELARLQEMLLLDPGLRNAAGELVRKRMEDEKDLVAATLVKVASGDVQQVWAEVRDGADVAGVAGGDRAGQRQ